MAHIPIGIGTTALKYRRPPHCGFSGNRNSPLQNQLLKFEIQDKMCLELMEGREGGERARKCT